MTNLDHDMKELYVHKRKQQYKQNCQQEGKVIDVRVWRDLIAQWHFDYDMERQVQSQPTR